ncbi:MAG TPA: adenosylcobalamin-dependent ribonucleoside-diphosphate reductase [Aestuariivirgaceae bacterium]|nr:adenosylcobalamin-dependent ribonucleoside-diphosphate reductase [Aestuariivirgaceae bacterium]
MKSPALEDLQPIARDIWDMKYRLKDAGGTPVDETVEHTWRRVANALAEPEHPSRRETLAVSFYEALEGHKFLPAGRILAGAGTGRRVTLFNCFVMGKIHDSMNGIFDGLREAALTMQQGGGIGHDFSTLRPKGAPVLGVGADASGPLSFMDVWDAMCRTIMSAGSRRGAMMATMRCDHPDIEAFIEAKHDPARLRMFNLSVLVTDSFIEAVREGKDWPLIFGGRIYRTLKARELWDKILHSTYAAAEPGVIFIDRINAKNNLSYCETIEATNPCGEQPLPPYGACLLGSINLTRFVDRAFEPEASLNLAALRPVVASAVRMMDNVIDVSRYPLEAQKQEALAKRRIGLGVTGLADALVMMGLRYGSAEAAGATRQWLAAIEQTAYESSIELARAKAHFPLFDRDAYLASGHIRDLPESVRTRIAKHGIRNALLTSIAPTGTISLFAGNVSSGIEPIFAFSYVRKVLLPDGSHREEPVEDYAVKLFRDTHGKETPLPDSFLTTEDLTPSDHLRMQAAAQAHVDSSISKTVNVPQSLSFEAFKAVYDEAYDLGLKGCTTFRPNEITGSVLTASATLRGDGKEPHLPFEAPEPPALRSIDAGAGVVYMRRPLERHPVLPGFTYKLRWPESDHAIYITINDILEAGGRRRPFEIFINSKNMEHFAWTVALTRMISAVFRRGGDVAFVVEELKAVFDPRGGQWMDGRYIPSLLAAIGGIIEKHMIDTGFLKPAEAQGAMVRRARLTASGEELGRSCPKCGQMTLIFQEGCDSCITCGYSKCS